MTTTRITTALLLAAGLLAAGCGGGGDDGGDGVASLDPAGSGSGDQADAEEEDPDAELMDWVECMRDEGIAMEDPVRDEDGNLTVSGPGIHIATGGGGGVGGGPGAGEALPEDEGERPPREDMEAATEACGDMPPIARGEQGEVDQEQMQETMLEFAECMRSEGVPDFPDPDFSESGPGGAPRESESGDGSSNGDGSSQRTVIGPFGEIDLEDPATAAAFEACQDVLGAPGGSGEGSGTTEGADT